MADNATIVACATGGGEGGWSARSLVRLSGPACGTIERLLLVRPRAASCMFAARLRLTEALELPCLAWSARGPATFTGEDTLELLVPGNPNLVGRVVARLCSFPGVRAAEPGEFSARAYLNGKVTIEQAEGIAAVIAAENSEQLGAAARVMSGATGRLFRSWAEEVAALLALVEAGIDFTDQEDVVAIEPRALGQRIGGVRRGVADFLGAQKGREAVSGRARVALVGRPNAGKSTLFNALLGRTRAVATPIAGTTRDVLVEPLSLIDGAGGEAVEIDLLDLPGLDRGAHGVDAQGQEAAREAIAEADVVVLCCERGAFETPPATAENARVVRVRTKADQPGWVEAAEVAVCSLTGAGLRELKRLLANAARGPSAGAGGGVAVSRHARSLRAAEASLAQVDPSGPGELAAHHLRAALDALGEVSGTVPPDEVIGRIFASFCIGK